MTHKPKILWSSDAVAMTGFARVTENLAIRLKDQFDIVILANNWWGDPSELQKDFRMYPSSNRFQTEPFGVQRIREVVEKEKPDIVFVNNDIWIANQLYQQVKDLHEQKKFKFVAYCPMDSYAWTSGLLDFANEWDALWLYTEFGARELHRAGYKKPIAVIPHGITDGQFFPMDKAECRKELKIPEDQFIVFNGNRNQGRKRIDITIDAFAQFAVDKPDTRLYLHMGIKDQGWDVMRLFARQMKRNGLEPNNRIIMTSNTDQGPNVDVGMLNKIYNAVDVGINTCKGEGHGLVNHEHAACRVAQIVPDHTSCREIFSGAAPLIRCNFIDVDMNYNRDMPCPSAEDLASILTEMYNCRDELDRVAEECYKRATDDKYQWHTIAHQVAEEFNEILATVETVEVEPVKEFIPRKEREALVI